MAGGLREPAEPGQTWCLPSHRRLPLKVTGTPPRPGQPNRRWVPSDTYTAGAIGRWAIVLRFEARSGDAELGGFVESTIWINEDHPAYVRAVESRSIGYHIALTVALALAPLAVGAAGEHAFLTQFLAQWGSSHGPPRETRRRARRRPAGA